MKNITIEESNLIAYKLFPNQTFPNGFKKEFREYISKRLNKLECCALYICEDNNLTQHFRKFMKQYPTLDCGHREIVIHESGAIDFWDNYRLAKTESLSSISYLGISF